MLFLDDIKTRSAELLAKLDELNNVNENFEIVKTLLNHRQPLSLNLLLNYLDLQLSMERLQRRILNIQNSMLKLSALIKLTDSADEELSDEKLLLQQILSESISSAKRYQQIIDLNGAESLTLCKMKDDVDYYLLNWTFAIESVLIEANLLNHVIENYV